MRVFPAFVLAAIATLSPSPTGGSDDPTPVTLIGSVSPLSARAAWVEASTSAGYGQYCYRTPSEPPACFRASTSIYATSDAGLHWKRVLRFSGRPLLVQNELPSLWMRPTTGRYGYVLPWTSDAEGKPARAILYRTPDGGRSWTRLPLLATLGYVGETDVAAAGRQNLWVLVHQGAASGSEAISVFRTRDAGGHWTRVACAGFGSGSEPGGCRRPSGIGIGGHKDDIVFTRATTGYLVENVNSGVPILLRSRDGGAHWLTEPPPLPAGVPPSSARANGYTYVTLSQPRFFGSAGLLPARASVCRARHSTSHASYSCSARLYALVSHDGGRTWPVTRPFPTMSRRVVDTITWQFVSARVWYAAAGTRLWSTRDAGNHWTVGSVRVPDNLQILGPDFGSATAGWALAARIDAYDGIASETDLLHTNDSGRTWQRIFLPGTS